MRLRRSGSVLASVALVGMGVMSGSSVFSRVPAAKVTRSARPLPLAPSHVLKTTLSFPPDTNYCRANIGIACYQPAQFQQAYDLQPLFNAGITGAGTTIVIVDAFGSPTMAADLHTFDQTFGLPDPPSFQEIEPAGAVPAFPADPFGMDDRSGWAVETTLDVEWSHVMAPGANILLVATPQSETEGVQGFPEIVQAENYVVDHNLGDVISQSFGATEQTFNSPNDILNLRSAFVNAAAHNVTVLGASGDDGATDVENDLETTYPFAVNSWPSADPLVTSVGGTQLNLVGDTGVRATPDVVWNDGFGAGGGGLSTVFARPSFQDHVKQITGAARGTPDISMSAAVDGGVVFFYSFCDYSRSDPGTGMPPLCGPQWHIVGGTSEASPLFVGIVALADQASGHRLGDLNPILYSHSSLAGVVDVTRGDNSFAGVTGFTARPGYDLASGIGTVDGAKFVQGLAHLTSH